MRILITNDDGIHADGLARLAEAAKSFGEVWVVAPDSERSAASHSITLRETIDVYPVSDFPVTDVSAFSCTGKPADCVRVGSLAVMPEMPDVVISGINYGYNTASDIQYSATCGAAFEGAFQGCLAIAISEEACPCHEVTDYYLKQVLEELLPLSENHKITERKKSDRIINVNFPGCLLEDCKGILKECTVSESMFFIDTYKVVRTLENGGLRYEVDGKHNEECEAGTDMRAVVDGYISVGEVRNVGSVLKG